MFKRKFLIFVSMALALVALSWGIDQAGAQPLGTLNIPNPAMGFNPAVDYTLSNFAYSPNIRKFVDSLPGLGAPGCSTAIPAGTAGSCNQNNLLQYIPIAVPNTTLYPGDEYYDMAVMQYTVKMHSDLPPTTLRGYQQVSGSLPGQTTDPAIGGVNQYLGPVIIAKSFDPTKPAGDPVTGNGRPVRLLFRNQLPVGAAGKLYLPVDTTLMGAGMGPVGTQTYTQNRVSIPHLHGGNTPWISDGTPHQWIVPSGEASIPAGATYDVYRKGMSFVNVPDMVGAGKSIATPAPGDGMGTLYWTNQQSQRLMFWHDHAYGITRLNVYGGMAAGYLLIDQVEEDMIMGTNVSSAFTTPKAVLPNLAALGGSLGVYKYGIPLVIQDRTFVNDANTPLPSAGTVATPTAKTVDVDPLWYSYVGINGSLGNAIGGNLWFPHEYMPNENIYDPTGVLAWGRWDYGPWMNPPLIPQYWTLPSPSHVPESYADTMIVNGTAFPHLNLPPTAVRFRILNACNDRVVNLQLYVADPAGYAIDATGAPVPPGTGFGTEVKMVPAVPNPAYPTWPKDGRNGGVPDPTTAGPPWIMFGNEGGRLPQVAVIPTNPVGFEYNRRVPTILNVTDQSLLIFPAERADVIVDLSGFAGKTLILYSDAPAPMPLFDERNDLYTGSPDWTAVGGAPSIPAGYGPNTRTIMQIRVGAGSNPAFDLASLQAALPQAYKATQAPPVVAQSAYDPAFGTTSPDTYVGIIDETVNLKGTPGSVSKVMVALPGSGYTTPPTVTFVPKAGGGGSGAAATACLNGVTAVTVTTTGTGYTSAPTVALTGGGGTGATAVATITGGGVSAVTVTNPGCNYTANPTVTFTGGGFTAAATATSGVTLGGVGAITITNGGSGYMKAPYAILQGGGGLGAAADVMLNVDTPVGIKNITEGFEPFYGRINVLLGTTPVPLDPLAPAPVVPGIANYIDPPSDIWDDGGTYVFRIAHIGVDSHIAHFHLANLQVVNRVDWTGGILPPLPHELGWKESIRTNPFTDLILAVRPQAQVLPFQIPHSVRLMDPTTPAGSTANYLQPAPVPGLPNPAGLSNKMTDYGWEYVWHCHLLGHEENDMMRPLVLNVPPPAAPVISYTVAAGVTPGSVQVVLTWPAGAYNTATSFTIQRSTSNTFPTGATTLTWTLNGLPPQTTYTDASVTPSSRYYYRVQASNPGGNSAWSNVVTVITVLPPSGLTGTATTRFGRSTVTLTWTNNTTTGVTGVAIQRATNAAFTGATTTNVNGANVTTRAITRLNSKTTYYFRVAARTALGNSAWSNVFSITTP